MEINSPHINAHTDVARIMQRVLTALIPGIIIYVYVLGWGILVNIAVALASAIASESLVLVLRKRPVSTTLKDYSAVVTALLLALCLPPIAPWWLVALSTSFAIIFAKHLYGGLGQNLFNPAMVGYVVAIISFPLEMTSWPDPTYDSPLTLVQTINFQFTGSVPDGTELDAITSATPMDSIKTQLGLSRTLEEMDQENFFGYFGSMGWEWINLGFLFGGLWLLINGTIRWHIPVALLSGIFITALVFQTWDSDIYTSPLFHWFSGGTMLAAFFIATDPVTASTTNRGRIIYGAAIGVIVYVIRTWGGYPDGIAFSVLLLNMAVPTIDYYTKPRVFGHREED